MTRRSAALVRRNNAAFDHSIEQPFIVAATTGSLTEASFARYLLIEESFVTTAVRVSAYALYAEPDFAAAAQHSATINELLGPQLNYFADVRANYVVAENERALVLEKASVLSAHVLGAVNDRGYAGAVVSMFAAETLYLRWCQRAQAQRELAQTNDLDSWILLHTSPEFERQVGSLAGLVDRLSETDQILDELLLGMLRAEDSFHGAAN